MVCNSGSIIKNASKCGKSMWEVSANEYNVIHIWCDCPLIIPYWRRIQRAILQMTGIYLPWFPRLFLLFGFEYFRIPQWVLIANISSHNHINCEDLEVYPNSYVTGLVYQG